MKNFLKGLVFGVWRSLMRTLGFALLGAHRSFGARKGLKWSEVDSIDRTGGITLVVCRHSGLCLNSSAIVSF